MPEPNKCGSSRSRRGGMCLIALVAAVVWVGKELPPPIEAQNAAEQKVASYSTLSAAARAGRDTFQQKCGFCHGADGSGGTGPDLLHSSLVLHDEDGNLIKTVVQGGRLEKGMPAFDLSPNTIEQIAAFLHEEIKADATIFGKKYERLLRG